MERPSGMRHGSDKRYDPDSLGNVKRFRAGSRNVLQERLSGNPGETLLRGHRQFSCFIDLMPRTWVEPMNGVNIKRPSAWMHFDWQPQVQHVLFVYCPKNCY